MKAIICGAGNVGTDIAEYLYDEDSDITIIDSDEKVLSEIKEDMDVRTIYGQGSEPSVLQDAGADSADLIIAVTPSDELNMIICLVADALFHIPVKIARIRSSEYLVDAWKDIYKSKEMPIDVVISPEIEMAKSIEMTLQAAGALEVISLSDGEVYLTALRCKADCPLIHTEISNILMVVPDLNFNVVALIRGGRMIKPYPDEQLQEKDEVYLLVKKDEVAAVLEAFGYKSPETNRIIIVGAGRRGTYLASKLHNSYAKANVTIIEKDEALAQKAAESLPDVNIINGDYLEPEILEEAGVKKAQTTIALTNFDEDNILFSLLAKRFEVGQTFSLVSKMPYHNLLSNLGVDVIIDPKSITISSIIPFIRRGGIKKAYAVRGGLYEMLEIKIEKKSTFRGKKFSALEMPKGAFFGGFLRDNVFTIPSADTVIQADDTLYILARHFAVKDIEKLFSDHKDLI